MKMIDRFVAYIKGSDSPALDIFSWAMIIVAVVYFGKMFVEFFMRWTV